MNIGIIGQGFVGNAVYQKFKFFFKVYTYDIVAKLCNSSYNDTLKSVQKTNDRVRKNRDWESMKGRAIN